jgi:hypothetical protein
MQKIIETTKINISEWQDINVEVTEAPEELIQKNTYKIPSLTFQNKNLKEEVGAVIDAYVVWKSKIPSQGGLAHLNHK